MKSSTLRTGVALACALSLSACGGGGGDLYLTGTLSTSITKDGLVLTNNKGNDLTIAAGTVAGTVFQFSNRISTDDEFNIEVKSVPSNVQGCNVTNGHARANVYTIAQIYVSCTIKQQALKVTINGLTGTGLQLVNGADNETVPAGTKLQTMANVYQDATYAVKVLAQPSGQTCTVSGGDSGNGSGTTGSTDVTSVVVNCVASA